MDDREREDLVRPNRRLLMWTVAIGGIASIVVVLAAALMGLG